MSVPCNPNLRDWYFFVRSEKDLKGNYNNAKDIIMVGNGEGYWKFRGNSYTVRNEDGELMGLKRDAVYYRIRTRSNPATKLPKRTHWAMDIYQLPIHFEQASHRIIVRGVGLIFFFLEICMT